VNQIRLTAWTCSAALMLAAAARGAAPEPRPYHVSHYDVTLQPNLAQRLIRGLVTLDIVALKDNLAGIDLDASDMMIIACGQGRRRFPYARTNDILHVDLPHPLKANQKIQLTIRYEATPQTGVRFSNDQMYTVFSTSHWLPCNDRPSDRALFTMRVIAPANLTVIASGEFVSARSGKGETISTWRVQHPISTYVASFAMGRFTAHSDRETSLSRRGANRLQPAAGPGTIVYLLSPEFRKPAGPQPPADAASKAEPPAPSAKPAVEAESIFATTRAAASFFAGKAGEPYPGKTYTVVFASTEIAQEADQVTLLSQRYFADVSDHPDDSWLLAHELAHQWWGVSVTCADWSDFWLNEGIATYMADAFLEKQYGKARYKKEIEHSHQVYREALINGQDRPLSYHEWTRPAQAGGPLPYHKGAWFLHLLRQQIGDDQFWLGLRQYTRGNWERSVVSRTFQSFFERSCRCNLQNLFNEYVYY
jgi:aminopeptidase N